MYWPRMVLDVREYIKRCEICKTTKPLNQILKPPMGSSYNIERPWQRIYCDLLGPYPRSKHGKCFILIVLDHLTKFVLLHTLNKANSSQIVKFLREDVFNMFNVPESLHTDNGAQFTGKEFSSLMQEFGIQHTKTAFYSPQSNASERVNRSILSAIRSYIKNKHNEWDKYLSDIASALRNSYHESIGFSPHYLCFGFYKINHANDYKILKELQALNDSNVEPMTLSDHQVMIFEEVRKHLKNAYGKNCKTYNLRSRPISYIPGQTVYYRQHLLSNAANQFSAKLAPAFAKAIIKSKVGNVNYVLQDENGKTLGTYHAKDIKT